jgi:hypothetical protein
MRGARMPRDVEDRVRGNGHYRDEIVDVIAANVETVDVEWLWQGRIPDGKLTMFDGDPDMGKSVVTMDIAARVSTGRGFPDGATCEAGNVLIVNVEDGVADTIVPRLKAHGADLERVFIFSSVPDGKGGTRLLDLPDDIALLQRKVIEREADLLIIDPVLTMLGGDANRDQDARKALTPVRDMAEQTGCAVVAVRHLNKSVGLKAIQRGGGNMGLIGVARAGSFFAEHPDDDRLRVMAAHKSNLAERPPSLSYRIVSSEVHNTARIEWMGATEHDANSLASGPTTPEEKTKLDEAKEFLRDELSDGPMWAKTVLRDANDAGVSRATLYTAKTQLRVRSEKVGTEGWQWSLPTKEDDDPPTGQDLQDVQHLQHLQNLRNKGGPDPAYIKEDTEGLEDTEDTEGKVPDDPQHHLQPASTRLVGIGPDNEPPPVTVTDASKGNGNAAGGGWYAYEKPKPDTPERLLADPPEWLTTQLDRSRNRPGLLKPTAHAVSSEVYGTQERWQEVMPLLEACLEEIEEL